MATQHTRQHTAKQIERPNPARAVHSSVQFFAMPLAQMNPETLYEVLKIRTDAFVVEQRCAYPELDGRDLEPETRMLWAEREGRVLATLRILDDRVAPDPAARASALRIGRVVAAPEARGSGIAHALFTHALEWCDAEHPNLPTVLDAQEPLERWYGAFGFERVGETFLEDGIPHVPMRRA